MAELEDARRCLEEVRLDEALEKAKKVVALAKSKRDARLEVEALQIAAEANLLKSNADEALQELKQAFASSRELKDNRLEGRLMHSMVFVHLMKNELSEALVAATESLALCRSLGDKEEEGAILHTLAQVHLARQGPSDALKVAKVAVAEFQSQTKTRQTQAQLLQTVANASIMEGNPEDALQATRRALHLFRELGDLRSEARTWNTIAQACLASEYPAEPIQVFLNQHGKSFGMFLVMNPENGRDGSNALQAVDRALTLFRKTRDLKGEAATLHTSAQIELAMGKLDEAAQSSRKALMLFRKSKDKQGEAIALCSVAQVEIARQEYDSCLQSLQLASNIFSECGNFDGHIATLSSIANVHLKQMAYQKAVRIAEEMVGTCQTRCLPKNRTSALRCLCMTQIASNNSSAALQAAQDLLDFSRSSGDVGDQISAFQILAKVYCTNGQRQDALDSAREARKIANMSETKRQKAKCLMAVYDIYVDLDDPQEAFKIVSDAQSLFSEVGDKKGETAALLIAASMLGIQRHVVDVATRAATLLQELGDELGSANLMYQAAAALVEAGEFARAGVPAGAALRVFREKGSRSMEAQSIELIAQVHLAQLERDLGSDLPSANRGVVGHGREGLRLAREAVDKFQQIGDNSRYAGALHTLASAHLLMEEAREGLSAAQEALTIFEKSKDRRGEMCATIAQAGAFCLMRENETAVLFAEKGKLLANELGDAKSIARADAILSKVKEGGLGERQTRHAAFFVQHPDTPCAKQCMELYSKLKDVAMNPASGGHCTILTRGVLSRPSCCPAPVPPGILAQKELENVLQVARQQMPSLKLGALDMPLGCSAKELGPSFAAALMPTAIT